MIKIRQASERGGGSHGWLETRHTFSFGEYWDPDHVGFRSLRVLNEDWIAPGRGFPTHPHRDMEILTYVLEGGLAHRDSMGNGSTIRPGEIQKMSAGTGVTHSEENPSAETQTHLLQIWIEPERRGVEPAYGQKAVPVRDRAGELHEIAGPRDDGAPVDLEQDARVFAAVLREGDTVEHALSPGRGAWVQVALGTVRLGDATLHAGDGAAIEDEKRVRLTGSPEGAEILVFDLA